LEYRPLPGDPVELVRARTAAPSPEAARSVFASFLDRLGDGVIEAAAAGTDMLLTAFGPAPLSRLVAEGFGIPSVGAYLAPAVPTQEFPPPGWPGTSATSGRPATSRRAASCSDGPVPCTPRSCRGCVPSSAFPPPRPRCQQTQARRRAGRSATASVRRCCRAPPTGLRRYA
jgi:hypothetical protein